MWHKITLWPIIGLAKKWLKIHVYLTQNTPYPDTISLVKNSVLLEQIYPTNWQLCSHQHTNHHILLFKQHIFTKVHNQEKYKIQIMWYGIRKFGSCIAVIGNHISKYKYKIPMVYRYVEHPEIEKQSAPQEWNQWSLYDFTFSIFHGYSPIWCLIKIGWLKQWPLVQLTYIFIALNSVALTAVRLLFWGCHRFRSRVVVVGAAASFPAPTQACQHA